MSKSIPEDESGAAVPRQQYVLTLVSMYLQMARITGREFFTYQNALLITSPLKNWDEEDNDCRNESFLKVHSEITAKLANFPARQLCQQMTLVQLSDRSRDFQGQRVTDVYLCCTAVSGPDQAVHCLPERHRPVL